MTLTLTSVTLSDAGEYVCNATLSSTGETEIAQFTLTVVNCKWLLAFNYCMHILIALCLSLFSNLIAAHVLHVRPEFVVFLHLMRPTLKQ